jgi:hypothetical protein
VLVARRRQKDGFLVVAVRVCVLGTELSCKRACEKACNVLVICCIRSGGYCLLDGFWF